MLQFNALVFISPLCYSAVPNCFAKIRLRIPGQGYECMSWADIVRNGNIFFSPKLTIIPISPQCSTDKTRGAKSPYLMGLLGSHFGSLRDSNTCIHVSFFKVQ